MGLRIKLFTARVLRFFYEHTPIWGLGVRIKFLLHGGRTKYLLKKFGSNKETINALARKNLAMHISCWYSKSNGGWCDLPCILCKGKFHDKRNNLPSLRS
jgi:hypothetical protein